MKTKLLYILLLFFAVQSYGQRKYAADRYFKEYAYKKSAELYKQMHAKGDKSQLVLQRLANSYYFNTETKEAEVWFSELLANYPEAKTPENLFRYSQVLKSNGNYSKSDDVLRQYKETKYATTIVDELSSKPNYSTTFSDIPKDVIINLHNLSVNTEYSDFGGFRKDNKLYYASAKPRAIKRNRIYKWNNQPFLNLYTANIEHTIVSDDIGDVKISELSDETIMPTNSINSPFHDATAIFTKDGSTMYFTRDNYDGRRRGSDKKRETHLKLYKASYVDGKWLDVEELPFNSDDYSIGHPALSPDENTLYFVSDMPGGQGATDIYKVDIAGANYGKPMNLGKPINTVGREMFPFVTKENQMYFSSDGHLGLGGLDIFKTNLSSSKNSPIENIESPFNSNLDDFSFTINDENNQGFLSSNREGGKGDDDIYSFTISPPPPVVCKENIAGVVTNKTTGQVIAGATVKLLDAQGKVISETLSAANGSYSFNTLDCETMFKVTGEKLDHRSDYKEVKTIDKNKETVKADLALIPLIIGNEIVINPIFFDFDKFYIRADAEYELEDIVTVMNNHPEMIIKIESHTDSRGTRVYNRRLSDNRAKSTRDYIISRGIAANRIQSAIGYGEDRLLNHCDDSNRNSCTEEEHQRNRRSKFIIVSGNTNNVKVNDPNYVPLKKIDRKPGR